MVIVVAAARHFHLRRFDVPAPQRSPDEGAASLIEELYGAKKTRLHQLVERKS